MNVSYLSELNPPSFAADHSLYAMVSCILLAAGESLRFGSPKPLARINSQTVIEFILSRLLKTKLAEIIVVLGAEAHTISPYVSKNERIKIIMNKEFACGQISSFKTGLTALAPTTRGIMLLPVDVPLITLKTIDLLIDEFLKNSCLILIPTYKGKRGHPPIFSIQLREEFQDLKNEEPLFSIQRKYDADTLKLPVDDEGVVLSFNTPQEFEQLIQKISDSE